MLLCKVEDIGVYLHDSAVFAVMHKSKSLQPTQDSTLQTKIYSVIGMRVSLVRSTHMQEPR